MSTAAPPSITQPPAYQPPPATQRTSNASPPPATQWTAPNPQPQPPPAPQWSPTPLPPPATQWSPNPSPPPAPYWSPNPHPLQPAIPASPKPKPGRHRTLLVLAGALVLVVASAAAIVVPKLNRNAAPVSAAPPSAAPVSAAPVDVLGTDVTATGNRVTAACFSFDMPKGFELNPESNSCTVAVAPPDTDALMTFTVKPFNSPVSAEEIGAIIKQVGLELVSSKDAKVNGFDAIELRFKDSYGLTHLRYIFNLPDGQLLRNGQPIGAIQIEGYTSKEYEELLWPAILDSFQLETPPAGTE